MSSIARSFGRPESDRSGRGAGPAGLEPPMMFCFRRKVQTTQTMARRSRILGRVMAPFSGRGEAGSSRAGSHRQGMAVSQDGFGRVAEGAVLRVQYQAGKDRHGL